MSLLVVLKYMYLNTPIELIDTAEFTRFCSHIATILMLATSMCYLALACSGCSKISSNDSTLSFLILGDWGNPECSKVERY
jgi:ATP/ADP translocase